MKKERWISSKAFVNKYKMTSQALYNQRVRNNPCLKLNQEDKLIYVDEVCLERRINFRRKVLNESIENIEYLKENGMKLADLLRELASFYGTSHHTWEEFVHRGIYSRYHLDTSILNYKIKRRLWNFWRYSNWKVRQIKKGDKNDNRRSKKYKKSFC